MRRITIITGHYGSGKSEFSVNLAILKKVDMVIDLDIVNPYFRSRETEMVLMKHNIRMISSGLKNALGSDLPFISGEVFLPFQDESKTAIIDLGGDSIGARLVRQFSDMMNNKEIDFLMCVNIYREATSTVDGIMKMARQIEGSSGLRITGLINNSNFLRETCCEDVRTGALVVAEAAHKMGLPILYTGIYEKIVKECKGLAGEIIPLTLYLRKNWL